MSEWLSENGAVLNVAHRGASKVTPENTIAAFERARALGADGIEFDVMKCASGEVVVIHDPDVDRTTDGHGPVASKTLDELKDLDASGEFHDRVGRVEIPTLDQALEYLGTDVLIDIEIKSGTVRTDGIEQLVVHALHRHALHDNVMVASFNPAALKRVRRLAPELPRALIFSGRQRIHLRRQWFARQVKPAFVQPHIDMVTPKSIARWRARGYRICPWTVNDRAQIVRMVQSGVNAVVSDDPAMVSAVLGPRPRY